MIYKKQKFKLEMRQRYRKFILDLPGTNSYCNCEEPCSPIEIEHAYPRALLKRKLDRRTFLIANKDPYNLHKCCRNINSKKGNYLLGKTYFGDEFSGMIARSCLYMDETYSLQNDTKLVKMWNNFSLMYPPFETEFDKAEIIKKHTGKSNFFIDLHRYH